MRSLQGPAPKSTGTQRAPASSARVIHPRAQQHVACRASSRAAQPAAAAVLTRAPPDTQERTGGALQQLGVVLPDGSILYTAELLRRVQVQLRPLGAEPPAPDASAPPAAAPPAQQQPVPAATAAAAAPAAPAPPVTPATAGLEELAQRRRWRVMREIVEAAERSQQRGQVRKGFRPTYTRAPAGAAPKYDPDRIMAGLAQLETLVPGFQPNLEALPADKWAELALDITSVGARLVALKAEWPTVDLTAMLLKYPKALLMTPEEIKTNAAQVRELLKTAKDADAIIQAVPQMLTPQVAASVLVTINKWWQFKQDPVAILESDPSLVLRAQEMDQPFEPVYQAADGTWVVPGANKAKRPEWAQQIADLAAKQKARKQLQQQQQQQQQARLEANAAAPAPPPADGPAVAAA